MKLCNFCSAGTSRLLLLLFALLAAAPAYFCFFLPCSSMANLHVGIMGHVEIGHVCIWNHTHATSRYFTLLYCYFTVTSLLLHCYFTLNCSAPACSRPLLPLFAVLPRAPAHFCALCNALACSRLLFLLLFAVLPRALAHVCC